jgi:hypothetical protein
MADKTVEQIFKIPSANEPTFSNASNVALIEDFAVKKAVDTVQGTILHTPTNPKDIVNKAYVDSVAGGLVLPLKQVGAKLYLDFDSDTYLTYADGQLFIYVNGEIQVSYP